MLAELRATIHAALSSQCRLRGRRRCVMMRGIGKYFAANAGNTACATLNTPPLARRIFDRHSIGP